MVYSIIFNYHQDSNKYKVILIFVSIWSYLSLALVPELTYDYSYNSTQYTFVSGRLEKR